jgi:hypothetical protein
MTAAAAGAQDATRLEPLVCFIIILLLPAARARDATCLELLVSFFFLFFLYYTNVYFRSTQHIETAMAAAAAAARAGIF